MKWLKQLIERLRQCVTTTVIMKDRVVYKENGRVIYDGPDADVPPHVRQKLNVMKADADDLRREFDL